LLLFTFQFLLFVWILAIDMAVSIAWHGL